MPPLVVICPLKLELSAFQSIGKLIKQIKDHKRLWQWRDLNQQSYLLLEGRVGSYEATKTCELLLKRGLPQLVLVFGTAGALSDQAKPGQLIMATSLLEASEDAIQPPFQPLVVNSGKAMLRQPILTNPQPVMDLTTRQTLFQQYCAWCVDMESSVIARVLGRAGVSVVVVRMVSDQADERALEDFKRQASGLIDTCRQELLDLLQHLLYLV